MNDERTITAEALREHLGSRDLKRLKPLLRYSEAADIAESFEELELTNSVSAFRLVPRSRRPEVFAHLTPQRQEELLEELPDTVVASVLNEMEPDDRTKLLEDLDLEIQNKIIQSLSPEERKVARELLAYPEDSVGRLMTPEFVSLRSEMPCYQALETLRWSQKLDEELLSYLFAADPEGRYVGDVSLAALVQADPPTKKVREIISAKQVFLRVDDEQSSAVDFFRKYDRPYFAVVDEQDVLVGLVTADDVFDVAEEEATEDIHQFGGQATLEGTYFQTSLMTLFRKRAGWLATLFLGGIITSTALKHYKYITVSMTWLVFFLPLIISSGGNTGSQSASLVIRGLAVREMSGRDWYKVLGREILVCIGLGIALGCMGFGLAISWNLSQSVGLVVAGALLGVVIFGGVTGAMLPFMFDKLKLDPAVSSSPLLASLVDIVGVLIFYNLAIYLLTVLQLGSY